MSNWERREAISLVEAIEHRAGLLPLTPQERQNLGDLVQAAKAASETVNTTSRNIQELRAGLCKICLTGRLAGCGPQFATTSRCIWRASA